ncbi:MULTISPECIES: MOSC domain-containing protein [Streptomyces]|jgi:MOSC domain-containing protein YiiM|uniref:MOSC domain-containing protein n=1 Tax=Streptomyces TaxID=1883 RepID=UPI000BB0CF81|nr:MULTISPECIES: MOSC domain-containing protein [Streptomyces]MCX4435985.1 MOSC domain-containing protein [Streptomyces mirabilis]PBC96825.1 MOSC domain-containing protein YiiM [Streptomyces sp. Ag82_O1-15]SOE68850.1 MOSC domain-containing protein YiiM [Streptomyces sp. OV198]
MKLLSLNIARPRAVPYTDHPEGVTGIDKRPVDGPVRVTAPGPKGVGASGLAGDAVCDLRHHGGNDQAVYAVAREDLDDWGRELGRPLASGAFGENLTTQGLDVSGARIGERWRVGSEVVLEVTSGRIPCRTFQGHVGEQRWVKRFTQKGAPGAYLRVIEPGEIRAGDPIEVVHRPDHEVTVAFAFRAETTERALLTRVLAAGDALHPELLEMAKKYVARHSG